MSATHVNRVPSCLKHMFCVFCESVNRDAFGLTSGNTEEGTKYEPQPISSVKSPHSFTPLHLWIISMHTPLSHWKRSALSQSGTEIPGPITLREDWVDGRTVTVTLFFVIIMIIDNDKELCRRRRHGHRHRHRQYYICQHRRHKLP